MDDHTARLFMFAQAEVVRAQGMVAENMQREYKGEAMAYVDEDFGLSAFAIEELARQIGG